MRKAQYFGAGFKPGIFFFIPTIVYSWGDCGCWKVSITWGNLFLDAWTDCNPDWFNNASGKG